MKEILKKLFVIILIAGNIILGVLYARIEAQYTMYKQFTEQEHANTLVPPVPPQNLPILK